MTPEIDVLEHAVSVARKRLCEAENALRAARIALSPFHVDDIVLAKRRGEWEEALIAEVEPRYGWYKVRYRKADGSWGVPRNALGLVRALEAEAHQ